MKRRFFYLVLALSFPYYLEARDTIVSTIIELDELILTDKYLHRQLDSVLTLEYTYPNSKPAFKFGHRYIYLTLIKEESPNKYSFDIIRVAPSTSHHEKNTGVYNLNDSTTLIVREKSNTPLFIPKGNKRQLESKRLLVKWNKDGDYEEVRSPEEFLMWFLYYENKKLKVTRSAFKQFEFLSC